ncbi:MAG: LapA family protein [Bacteroidota bacterium]|nr:LapA family protein [Bacteroidota bacterium]
MDTQTIIATVIGVVIGGLITWFVSWKYYVKAGKELMAESKKLKETSDLILYKLQYPDAKTELKRNEQGEVTGLTVEMRAEL